MLMGISFSVIPAVIWPSTAMLAMFASLSLIGFVSTVLLLLRERRQPGGGIEARVIGDVAPTMLRH